MCACIKISSVILVFDYIETNKIFKMIHFVSTCFELNLIVNNPSFFSSHNEPNDVLILLFETSLFKISVAFIMYLNLDDLVERYFNMNSTNWLIGLEAS